MLSLRPYRLVSVAVLLVAPYFLAAQAADPRDQIIKLFQAAQEAEQVQDFSKSVAAYRDIAKIDPRIAEVWSNMGMALFHLGANQDAIFAFQKASALKPALLAPHVFAGLAYLNLDEPQRAIAPLKTALALSPNQQEATLALGDAYAQTFQFEASIRLLQKALQRDPDSESVGSNLAVSYLDWAKEIGRGLMRSPSLYGRLLSDRVHATKDPETAEGAFRDTVAFAPGSAEAHLAYARFLMEIRPTAEKLGASEEQITEARRIAPDNLEVAAAVVRLAIAQNDIPRASTLLWTLMQEDPAYMLANLDALADGLPAEDALKIKEKAASMAAQSSGSSDSYSSRLGRLERIKSSRPLSATEDAEYASAAWHLHRYDEALSDLMNRHRTDPVGQYWLFRTCEALGRDVLERTVNAHPDSVRSHLLLADFAIQQDNLKAARSEYEAALSLRPHDPEIILLNVRLLETAKESRQALQEAMRGAADFPLNAGLNFEAGELMLRSDGDAEAAAKYLERALQTDSRLVRARTDLADAYAQLKRFDDAIREVHQIISTDDDGALHYRLARWYRQTGQADEAAKALELCKRKKEQRLEKERSFTAGRSAETNYGQVQ
jgi:tetratricopeptide (TPR) repeat protein